VFWRNRARLTGGARGWGGSKAVVVCAAVAVAGVAVMGAARGGGGAARGGGGAARGGGGPARGGGGAAGAAVGYRVSAAEQRAALAYWTPARMAAAQAAGVPQGAAAPNGKMPKNIPQAVHFTGVRTVGALFSTTGGKAHFCSASVVDSPGGDIIVTAAHCVYGSKPSTNIAYAPGYNNERLPYHLWAIQGSYVWPSWQSKHDPNMDIAFLTVSRLGGREIQAVTGGLRAGFMLGYLQTIEVVGYNDTDSEPSRCLTRSFKFRTDQMEFYCHGFRDGTSGGPWVIGYNGKTGSGTVFGVIGGYEQGGALEWASYSSYFGVDARDLLRVAEKAAASSA
jgi:V8-like Glu-specific endopeptidase